MVATEETERRLVCDVAAELELHPFDLVRAATNIGVMGPSFTFGEEELRRLIAELGIEPWWAADEAAAWPTTEPERGVALGRALAWKLVALKPTESQPTRADNLYRGVGSDDRRRLRKLINDLIRHGVLSSMATPRGIEVFLRSEGLDLLEQLADEASPPELFAELGR